MVPEIKKILFATDLSENSRHAFQHAASVATRHSASMVLIHVMDKIPGDAERLLETLLGAEKWEELQETHERTARDILIGKKADHDVIRRGLAEFCASAAATDPQRSFDTYEIIVTSGNAPEEILKAADERVCNLIVIGSHKGMLGKTSVGSVAKNVLGGTKVPVLVVPPPAS